MQNKTMKLLTIVNFVSTKSFTIKTNKIMMEQTVHTFNSINIRFANEVFVCEDNIINCELISSIKFRMNMRNVLTKSFRAFMDVVTNEQANQLSFSVYCCPKPYLAIFFFLVYAHFVKF